MTPSKNICINKTQTAAGIILFDDIFLSSSQTIKAQSTWFLLALINTKN